MLLCMARNKKLKHMTTQPSIQCVRNSFLASLTSSASKETIFLYIISYMYIFVLLQHLFALEQREELIKKMSEYAMAYVGIAIK